MRCPLRDIHYYASKHNVAEYNPGMRFLSGGIGTDRKRPGGPAPSARFARVRASGGLCSPRGAHGPRPHCRPDGHRRQRGHGRPPIGTVIYTPVLPLCDCGSLSSKSCPSCHPVKKPSASSVASIIPPTTDHRPPTINHQPCRPPALPHFRTSAL